MTAAASAAPEGHGQTMLRKPYVVFLGKEEEPGSAKTAFGLRDWCPGDVLAQTRIGAVTVDLGVPSMTPAEAAAAGAGSLVIGIAPFGGAIPDAWHPVLFAAVEAGLDVVSGMHMRLRDVPGLAAAAAAKGVALHDIRHPERRYRVGSGRKRTGFRLATVGTDCALGKKYTALTIAREMQRQGMKATFRATGQTGIMIAGGGVPIDAVVADFVAGAAEWLSPDNDPDHWDVIEGQGSLFHPAYAGVTLGLLHGSQPDALVLCHDPTRKTIDGYPDFPIADLGDAMELYLANARITNPKAQFVGIGLNTSKLDAATARAMCEQTARRHGLPAFDPIRDGAGASVTALRAAFHEGVR